MMHTHSVWGLHALVTGLLGFGLAAASPQMSGAWSFLLSPPGVVIGMLAVHSLVALVVDVLPRPAMRVVLGMSGLLCSAGTIAAVGWAWTLGAPTPGLGVFAVVCVVLALGPLAVTIHRDWTYTRSQLAELGRSNDQPSTF